MSAAERRQVSGAAIHRRSRINLGAVTGALAAVYLVMAAVLGARLYTGEYGRAVIWPLITVAVTSALFIVSVTRRPEGSRLVSLPVLFVGMLSLYACWPLLSLVASGFHYTDKSDGRLFTEGATPAQMAALAWWYVAFLISFTLVFRLARRPRAQSMMLTDRADGALILTLVLSFVFIRALVVWFGFAYDLSSGSYIGGYAAVARLPLLPRQLLVQVMGWDLTIQIFLIVALFSRYRRARWWIAAMLSTTVTVNLLRPGARTQLFLLIVAAILAYAHLVRPVTLRMMIAVGAAGFVLFGVIAHLREHAKVASTPASIRALITAPNEFEAVMANAFDLKYAKHAAGAFIRNPRLYFSEFVSPIPQQFLPFQKTTASLWYVSAYYPEFYAAGGGLAFGVLAEAIVGFGIVEMIWRGALVGLLFALADARFASGRVRLTEFMFYTWLSVWSFQMIRNTTFCLITLFLYRFVVPLLTVLFVAHLLRRGRVSRSRAVSVEAQPV